MMRLARSAREFRAGIYAACILWVITYKGKPKAPSGGKS
jgi:hypothetical protein